MSDTTYEWSSVQSESPDEELLSSCSSLASIGPTESFLDMDLESSSSHSQDVEVLSVSEELNGKPEPNNSDESGQSEFEALTDHLDSTSIHSSSASVESIGDSQSSRLISLMKIENFVLDIVKQIGYSGKRKLHQNTSLGQPSSCRTYPKVPIVALLKNRSSLNPNKCHKLRFPKKARNPQSGSGARELAQLLRVLELSHSAIRRNVIMTKRDVFYNDVNLFINQKVVNQLVDDLAATFNLTRGQLHFTASPKGLFQGDLELITCEKMVISGKGPPVLIPASDIIKEVKPGAEIKFILVIEKEAVLNSLVGMNFSNDQRLGSSILICGIGYPNLSTLQLVHRLSENKEILKRQVPVHMLVDCDPHGLDIAKVYKFGSQSMAFHPGLCSNRAEWLGVKSSDWEEFNIDTELLCNMSPHDYDKANHLLKLEILPESWKKELINMKQTGKKSEIQILYSTTTSTKIKTRDPTKNKDTIITTTREESWIFNDEENGLIAYLLKRLSPWVENHESQVLTPEMVGQELQAAEAQSQMSISPM